MGRRNNRQPVWCSGLRPLKKRAEALEASARLQFDLWEKPADQVLLMVSNNVRAWARNNSSAVLKPLSFASHRTPSLAR